MGLIKWQHEHDRERVAYRVLFPNPLPLENVQALLHALSTSLHRGLFDDFTRRQTIVFEAWASGTGINYRLLIPWKVADQITSEFRHLVPGTILAEDDTRPRLAWDDVAEISLSDKTRTINASAPYTVATDMLSAMAQALHDKETALIQWVLAPANPSTPPPRNAPVTSTRNGWMSLVLNQTASSEEVEDRRKKLEQPCYQLVGRLAARAKTQARATHIVDGLYKSLKTANGTAYFRASKGGNIDLLRDRVNFATTPYVMPVVLNVPEVCAILGLPLGSPSVPGLPRTQGRPLYATEEVPRQGRHLGMSNFDTNTKRPVAMSYDEPVHTYVGGKTGHGKTVLLANSAAQDMERGYGVVIIDASDSKSDQTLFNTALNYVPRERLQDVIIMDIADGADRPVGLNLLDQGDPERVVSQLSSLMEQLYPDSKGVWTPALIFHGMKALIEYGDAAIIDLLPLLRPRPEELAWVRSVIRSIKDKHIRAFMDDWMGLKEEERQKRSQPLYDRLWQLNNRPEFHNIFGQSKSAFDLRDVLENNKILFINLAGLPQDTAGLIGTSVFQKLWEQAQRTTPKKPNFIYLDEVQQMTKINVGLDDIMARGRKHKFFLTTATQYLKHSKVSEETRVAIVNNTGTKILFTSGAEEAKFWLPEFGGRLITEAEITGLRKFDAIARIATEHGPGDPVTFTAAPPFKPQGTAEWARKVSDATYGTPVEEVEKQIEARRRTAPEESEQRPAMGRRKIA